MQINQLIENAQDKDHEIEGLNDMLERLQERLADQTFTQNKLEEQIGEYHKLESTCNGQENLCKNFKFLKMYSDGQTVSGSLQEKTERLVSINKQQEQDIQILVEDIEEKQHQIDRITQKNKNLEIQSQILKEDIQYIIENPEQIQKVPLIDSVKAYFVTFKKNLQEKFTQEINLKFKKYVHKQDYLEELNTIRYEDKNLKMLNLLTKIKTFAELVRLQQHENHKKLLKLNQNIEDLARYNNQSSQNEKKITEKFSQQEHEILYCKEQILTLKQQLDQSWSRLNSISSSEQG